MNIKGTPNEKQFVNLINKHFRQDTVDTVKVINRGQEVLCLTSN